MNQQQSLVVAAVRQPSQDFPSPIPLRLSRLIFEELARPIAGALRSNIEITGLEKNRVVMIAAHDDRTTLNDQIQALLGAGAVTDHVTEANHFLDAAPVDVAQNGMQRFQVAVNVGNDREHVV